MFHIICAVLIAMSYYILKECQVLYGAACRLCLGKKAEQSIIVGYVDAHVLKSPRG